MSKPELNVLQSERCDNLRWKGLFVHADADANSPGHIFWCLKTQIGLGPDGNPVDNYECNPARPCYKPL
jgi:hypothetical protein